MGQVCAVWYGFTGVKKWDGGAHKNVPNPLKGQGNEIKLGKRPERGWGRGQGQGAWELKN